MNEHNPDAIILRGRIQMDTVRNALEHTGINPDVEGSLRAALDYCDVVGVTKEPLAFHVSAVADVVKSLEIVSEDNDLSPELRIAADALRQILQKK